MNTIMSLIIEKVLSEYKSSGKDEGKITLQEGTSSDVREAIDQLNRSIIFDFKLILYREEMPTVIRYELISDKSDYLTGFILADKLEMFAKRLRDIKISNDINVTTSKGIDVFNIRFYDGQQINISMNSDLYS